MSKRKRRSSDDDDDDDGDNNNDSDTSSVVSLDIRQGKRRQVQRWLEKTLDKKLESLQQRLTSSGSAGQNSSNIYSSHGSVASPMGPPSRHAHHTDHSQSMGPSYVTSPPAYPPQPRFTHSFQQGNWPGTGTQEKIFHFNKPILFDF